MKSDEVLKYEGMKLLTQHLGLVGAERFITLLNNPDFIKTE